MVNLLSSLLAAGLVTEVALAKMIPKFMDWSDATHCPDTLGKKKWHCDDDLCGGENPDNKGHCTLTILQRLPTGSDGHDLPGPLDWQPLRPCPCTTGDEDGYSGVVPIAGVIPFIVPIGYVTPPPEVPNPQDPDTCPMDYAEVKCKDCKAVKNWCTVGDHAGCPCTEDCPVDGDDNVPDCDDVACQGTDDDKCALGLHKDCKCKRSKPDCPNLDEKYLKCEADYCKGEKKDGDNDPKCTAEGEFNDCVCNPKDRGIHSVGQEETEATLASQNALGQKLLRFAEEAESEMIGTTCAGDPTETVDIDTGFMEKMADKFCSGKEDEARLFNSMIDSDDYGEYNFHFTRKAGNGCKTSCKDAIMDLIKKCQPDSHSIRSSADGTIDKCGASYSYSITASEGCSDDATEFPMSLFRDTITNDFCGAVDEKTELEWAVDSSGHKSKFIKRDVPHFLQRRTPPASSKSYTKFKTTLKFSPTGAGACTKSCKDAFYKISQGKCGKMGNEQNMMARNGALDVGCGTYSYDIRWTGQKELQRQHCHHRSEFPGHTEAQSYFKTEKSKANKGLWHDTLLRMACGAEKREELKVVKGKKTDLSYVTTTHTGTLQDPHDYNFSVYWVDGCELDGGETEQSHAYPLGKDYRYKGKEVTCESLLLGNFINCPENLGNGGWIDAGCARYAFRPTR